MPKFDLASIPHKVLSRPPALRQPAKERGDEPCASHHSLQTTGLNIPPTPDNDASNPAPDRSDPSPVAANRKAAGLSKPRVRRGMNKTEAAFALRLEAMKQAGEILDYRYEGMRLKWGADEKTGDSMWYKADFCVFREEIPILLIETKGAHIWSRDVVRFKGCRSGWPCFDFELWQLTKGQWKQLY